MDRNREARRATNMAAPPNGLSSSSRRRHRSSSLRDSPDEDGAVELQESGRLRDRGVIKKDRGDRDRDRDRERERERSSRSKRRRESRMMIHHATTGSNRDDGDDTSEESVNDEDEEDDDDAGNGGGLRMLPPPPANPSTAAPAIPSNHHNNPHPQQLHHRKSFPPSANKVFRTAAAPPPAWKAADEMIGVSVPRKARSASTKRSHEWISGGAVVVGGGGPEQVHRQSSTSPVRLASSAASSGLVAPPSPSSSNVSIRKKMKANGGGSKPRPPKSSSKSSSSNPEELEIEIAEVLYGLMTQSQAPSKKEIQSNDSTTKFDSNKSSSDTKSRVSSPISNSTVPPQSLSTVAPKRKRPRQVSENPFSVRSSPVSPSVKTEIDHHQHHQSPKTDISSPYLENNSSGSAGAAGENGVSFGFTSLPLAPPSEPSQPLPQPPVEEEEKCAVLTKVEVEKESPAVGINNGNGITEAMITTTASTTVTNVNTANSETENQNEEKFEIDLMAPPQPERDGGIDFSDHKQQISTQEMRKKQEDEKLKKSGKEETMTLDLTREQKPLKAGSHHETGESSKQAIHDEKNIELRIDLEKSNKDMNRGLHQALKHQQLSAKSSREETHTEKTAQQSSMPLPMSVANWPPMGYMAPMQGVIPMDGSKMPSPPIQPIFTHPRPKRCATHCYIARNIHYLQQFMKVNPFWPAASGSAPMFGAKPCNLNVMPSNELHGNIAGASLQSMQDKGVAIFAGKENKSSQSSSVPDHSQRKQQVLLQQAMPPVTPNNILHGPAFIFPFNQQQAVAASASVRPGSSKLANSTSGAPTGATNAATVSTSTTPPATALSFNYPNMPANETQYLAILQNSPYTYPIPAVGAPPNYRGNPHAQAMPLFNGSFYSSQMIHPSQIPQPPQQAPQTQPQNHNPPSHSQQTHQNSSGSTSSSQKHLQQQAQQRQQGAGAAINANGGSLHNNNNNNSYQGHKSRSQPPQQNQNQQHMNPSPQPQPRHLENEAAGGEDSPSTADSRVSRAATPMSVYGHNFVMPAHSQNFAMMSPPSAVSGNNPNDKKQQQQQGLKRSGGGVDSSSSLPPQTFAMSFAPMNGTTGTISSMAQNHAIFQSLPESLRQSYHHMMAAPASAHHSQQKKDFRLTEEASRTGGGHESLNGDDDRKGSNTGKPGQSIAFSRPDLASDASPVLPGSSVIDSSSRNINLGSNNRSSRSPMSNSVPAGQSSHHLHAQFHHQQQQVLQLQKQQQQQQQQQQQSSRSKNQVSSNGSAYPDHLGSKFPNSLSTFPQNLVQSGNTPVGQGQSPQWRNSVRGPTTSSQVPSSLTPPNTSSSLKNLHQSQQQSNRSHPPSHTQISFGATAPTQKLPSTASSQMQQPNPGSSSGNQCPSPPMLVGSPTTSSISKGTTGAGGSPRTNASASTSGRTGITGQTSTSSQPPKNSPVGNQRSSPLPSILGNQSNAAKSQQQLPKQALQQQQQQQANLFFSHPPPYMQVQQQPQAHQNSGNSTTASGTSGGGGGGYYLPRKQQQQQQNPSQSSSTSMLSLCPPVTGTTSDPAKAIAAATSNLKGGSQQGIIHAYAAQQQQSSNAAAHQMLPAGFPQYAPPVVQVKPAEQKQPAGNDNLRTCWQSEKK